MKTIYNYSEKHYIKSNDKLYYYRVRIYERSYTPKYLLYVDKVNFDEEHKKRILEVQASNKNHIDKMVKEFLKGVK